MTPSAGSAIERYEWLTLSTLIEHFKNWSCTVLYCTSIALNWSAAGSAHSISQTLRSPSFNKNHPDFEDTNNDPCSNTCGKSHLGSETAWFAGEREREIAAVVPHQSSNAVTLTPTLTAVLFSILGAAIHGNAKYSSNLIIVPKYEEEGKLCL